ncbi:MAG: NAD(P)H-binding protein [Halolamina sp.]
MDVAAQTVLVAGATGDTGREVVSLLDGRVESVRALTRSAAATARLRALGADEVVVEDLLAPEDLTGALAGVDAVVSAVGSSPAALLSGPPFVDGAGTRALVEAAVAAGAERFVMLSALGVGEASASALGAVFDLFIGPLQDAKADAERAVREAPPSHTILRPGLLTNGAGSTPATPTVAEPGAELWGAVARRDVARLLVASLATPAATDRTLEVVSTPAFPGRAADVDWTLPGTDATTEPEEP